LPPAYANDTVSYSYHASVPGLRTGLTVQQTGGGAWAQSGSYDATRRLSGITAPKGGYGYIYSEAGGLAQGVTHLTIQHFMHNCIIMRCDP